jgi:hypothetical protein
MGICANDANVERLVATVALGQSEQWQVRRCYRAKHSLERLIATDECHSDDLEPAA